MTALAAGCATSPPAGERTALRERMEQALFVESIDNSSSPFCMFCSKGACSAGAAGPAGAAEGADAPPAPPAGAELGTNSGS